MSNRQTIPVEGRVPTDASGSGPVRIWLVDDNKNFRALVADLLEEEEGLECCRQFSSAEAAIEALACEPPPDVILLDIEMTGINGLEALRPIKSIATSTHVLMLTGCSDHYSKTVAFRNGASDFLWKNDDLKTTLPTHIRRVIESEVPVSSNPIGQMPESRTVRVRKPQRCSSSPLARGVRYLGAWLGWFPFRK